MDDLSGTIPLISMLVSLIAATIAILKTKSERVKIQEEAGTAAITNVKEAMDAMGDRISDLECANKNLSKEITRRDKQLEEQRKIVDNLRASYENDLIRFKSEIASLEEKLVAARAEIDAMIAVAKKYHLIALLLSDQLEEHHITPKIKVERSVLNNAANPY